MDNAQRRRASIVKASKGRIPEDTVPGGHSVEYFGAGKVLGRSQNKFTQKLRNTHLKGNNDTKSSIRHFIERIDRKAYIACKGSRSEGLRKIFHQLDCLNADGHIDLPEFIACVDKLGIEISAQVRHEVRNYFDMNGDGFIDMDEFLTRCQRPLNKHRGKVLVKAWKVMQPEIREGVEYLDIERLFMRMKLQHHPGADLKGGMEAFHDSCTEIKDHIVETVVDENDQVSKEEYIKYFTQVSQEYMNDEAYCLMVARLLQVSYIPYSSFQKAMKTIRRKVLKSSAGDEGKATQRITNVFKKFDSDHNKKLDYDEFVLLLHALDVNLEQPEMRALYEYMDIDHNGSIDPWEFHTNIMDATNPHTASASYHGAIGAPDGVVRHHMQHI